jgi:TetR/AcrR family transcriptional repressor of mexCD-oprJ operon
MRLDCLVERNSVLCAQTLVSQPAPIPAPAAPQRPTGNHALQQRVTAVILEAAARLLAHAGGQASMNDVAAAAGVARATVYRYFPSRQALLDRLAELAVTDAGTRLASARIEEVQPEEGVTRAVRALVDVGDYFIALARERIRPAPDEFEEKIAGPLRRLIERAQASGDLRADVPSSWLTESLVALVVGALSATLPLGREDAIAAITSMFLDGARSRLPSTLAP